MSQHEGPAKQTPVANPQLLTGSPGADPVAAAEEHLSRVDMAAQRAILRALTK
jgi:hypothetical protein